MFDDDMPEWMLNAKLTLILCREIARAHPGKTADKLEKLLVEALELTDDEDDFYALIEKMREQAPLLQEAAGRWKDRKKRPPEYEIALYGKLEFLEKTGPNKGSVFKVKPKVVRAWLESQGFELSLVTDDAIRRARRNAREGLDHYLTMKQQKALATALRNYQPPKSDK